MSKKEKEIKKETKEVKSVEQKLDTVTRRDGTQGVNNNATSRRYSKQAMAYSCGYDDTLNKQGPTPLKSTGGDKMLRKDKMRKIRKGIIKDPVTTDPEYVAAQKKYNSLKKSNPKLASKFRNKMN